jgi:acyl-CoA thioesterase FadM
MREDRVFAQRFTATAAEIDALGHVNNDEEVAVSPGHG